MATTPYSQDPLPPSLSKLRRRLLTAGPTVPEPEPAFVDDDRANTIDFESVTGSGLLDELQEEPTPVANSGSDEVEALLQRYQAEKGVPEAEPRNAPSLPPLTTRRAIANGDNRQNGGFHGEVLRAGGGSRIPTPARSSAHANGASGAEVEKLRGENNELKAMVGELREYLEAHDPEVLAKRVAELEQAVAERDEVLASQKQHLDEWQERLKTHRFVSSDDEVAQMADEVEKERCQLTQDRKELDDERAQLKEDEDELMKQMREMEVSMAKDRAELARQRTELQRLHSEVKHELDILQRGDATMKERMAQFQRRHTEVISRPGGVMPPQAQLAPPQATPLAAAPPKPRDSGVFKRIFGQGG